MADKYYEWAREVINSEFEQFDGDPKGYIESMAWEPSRYPNIEKLKGELAFSQSEVESLAKAFRRDPDVESFRAATESDKASDYATNLLAKKIMDKIGTTSGLI